MASTIPPTSDMSAPGLSLQRIGSTGLELTNVTLGTMTWGGHNTEEEAHAQLECAFERGIVGIDSAELYPSPPNADSQGLTEKYIGNWISSRGGPNFRDKLVLCSKVLGTTPGVFDWIRGADRNLSRANIRAAVDGILARLGTDYIDLLQLHCPERYVPMFGRNAYDIGLERECIPVLSQIESLAELIQEGKIRHYGLSNETAWGISQFDAVARANGLPRPASVQNPYCLLNRDFESHLAEACSPRNTDVSLMAYSPLAGGVLTGKYMDGQRPANARFSKYPMFMDRYTTGTAGKSVEGYHRIAREAGLTMTELALAWCNHQWFVGSTVIGATSVEQLEENLKAFDVVLDDAVLVEINKLHTSARNPSLIT